jgi:hypothetical protein
MGAGDALGTLPRAKWAKGLPLGSWKGQGEASRPFRGSRLSAVWVVDATKDGRRRALREPWVPVQEGKERKLALARPRKLRRPGGHRPGGFHIENLIIKG